MSSKVFVGNLSFDTSQGTVENLFSEVGEVVDVFLPSDRMTGRPRGFAFVEFADSDSVAEAIEKFDGYELGGRNLRVNEAEERRPRFNSGPPGGRGGFGGGGGGGGGGQRPPWEKPARPKGSRRNLRRKKRSL